MAQETLSERKPRPPLLRPAIREAITGWLFALPWIIGFIVFTVGPMAFSAFASFTDYNITTDPHWVGTQNYSDLFHDDRFYLALGNTFWMVLVKVPLVTIASIGIALLLNLNLPGDKAFRSVFYLPQVLSGVAAIFLWKWILSSDGLFNNFLHLIGVPENQLPAWFSDPLWTKPGLVIMGMWWIGGNILIFLAGLKGIPDQLYEAAAIDGAKGWPMIRHITLPMLSPTIFFQVVTGIIAAFQIFTTAYILSSNVAGSNMQAQGGPDGSLLFYVLYLYNRAFGKTGAGGFQMGYASAMAWVLFIIILIVTFIQLRLAKRWVYYETGDDRRG
ncbi:MAG TPA: sugar ABC transporter permease [Chloroflexia bacterium]|nr:sugar ABC transporter permease [Chloroflexia bacterium]